MDATTVITSRCEQQAVCIRNRGKDDLPYGILFNGHLVAGVSDYSAARIAREPINAPIKWREFSIYQTSSGEYVCSKATKTPRDDIGIVEGGIFADRDEVLGFFGTSDWLARELLQIAEML